MDRYSVETQTEYLSFFMDEYVLENHMMNILLELDHQIVKLKLGAMGVKLDKRRKTPMYIVKQRQSDYKKNFSTWKYPWKFPKK